MSLKTRTTRIIKVNYNGLDMTPIIIKQKRTTSKKQQRNQNFMCHYQTHCWHRFKKTGRHCQGTVPIFSVSRRERTTAGLPGTPLTRLFPPVWRPMRSMQLRIMSQGRRVTRGRRVRRKPFKIVVACSDLPWEIRASSAGAISAGPGGEGILVSCFFLLGS